jgi:flagellar biosynthesis/type III secretory pathway M-ring protein FliF/YscJ
LGKQAKKQFWWEQVQNLIYPLLALGVLFFFWRAFKRTAADQIPLEVPAPTTEAESELAYASGHGRRPGLAAPGRARANTPGVVTVETLNQLVRENPANVAQAIQNWLGGSGTNVK